MWLDKGWGGSEAVAISCRNLGKLTQSSPPPRNIGIFLLHNTTSSLVTESLLPTEGSPIFFHLLRYVFLLTFNSLLAAASSRRSYIGSISRNSYSFFRPQGTALPSFLEHRSFVRIYHRSRGFAFVSISSRSSVLNFDQFAYCVNSDLTSCLGTCE